MPHFVTLTILPYQERAIVNLDAVAIVTTKAGPDGARGTQLQMVDGSKVVTTVGFADMQQALSATLI
jgi:hypothetical protein